MLDYVLLVCYLRTWWAAEQPPLNDWLLPASTLLTASRLLWADSINWLAIIALLFDAAADHYMNSTNPAFSILLFSLGHLSKHYVYAQQFGGSSRELLLISVILTQVQLIWPGNLTAYILLLLATTINVSTMTQSFNLSYACFLLSDALIGYELFYQPFICRQIRVIGVPLLYWLAQILFVLEIKSF